MRRILVMLEETCATCDGDGVVEHSAWKAYTQYAAANALSTEDLVAWSDKVQEFWCSWNVYRFRQLPCEEVVCPVCKGKKVCRREIDLAEALTMLQR